MLPRLKVVFCLDMTLLISFCALEQVPFTGMVVHEWLGLAVAVMIVVHLLLSWTWVASNTRRLITGASSRTRINYILNACLFGCFTVAIFSGVLISQQAIPALTRIETANMSPHFPWNRIHDSSSDLLVILAAMHLAINWDWMAAAARGLLRRRGAGAP
jgi:cytochrome b